MPTKDIKDIKPQGKPWILRTAAKPQGFTPFVAISRSESTTYGSCSLARSVINSTDIPRFKKIGFDSQKYYKLQKNEILKRADKFSNGKLYLEIGGKFLFDPHAARVLPGFDPIVKQKVLADLIPVSQMLFCVNYDDIMSNRQLKNTDTEYLDATEQILEEILKKLGIRPYLVINKSRRNENKQVAKFVQHFQQKNYSIYRRYQIPGYPHNPEKILSKDGFGQDDYIVTDKKIVIVTGVASNSGKMSTCLGQIYLDHLHKIESGYAKYELFPIWNLPLEHPVNLAYEAATADIGDFNVYDQRHWDAYQIKAVNYNRDSEGFQILKRLTDVVVDADNYLNQYKSPTDMGINTAGLAITDDKVVKKAALREIKRRLKWYQDQVERGDGSKNWANKCRELEIRAKRFIQ